MLGQSGPNSSHMPSIERLMPHPFTSLHITSRWISRPEQCILEPEDDISCSHVDAVSPTPDDEYANIARVTVAQQPSLPAADLRLWNITNRSWRRITARNLVLAVMF